MPKSLPANLIIEKNKISTNQPWLILLDIVLTDDTVFKLVRNNEDITFQGNVYTAIEFEIDAEDQSSNGNVPTIKLSVSNVTRLLQSYIEALDGGIKSSVTITVVNNARLTEDYAELETTLDVLGCETGTHYIVFTLGAKSPLLSGFPRYQYIANYCNWKFTSFECGYTGQATTCNRTLENCRLLDNSERYGGSPGLSGGGIRVVH